MNIILSTGGINWEHYIEICLDRASHTAVNIKSWRLHRTNIAQGASSHPKNSYSTNTWTVRLRISDWKDAGKPGGLKGLKKNYKIKNPKTYFYFGDEKYELLMK